jgi:coenzyme F420 hydrogenase subunit beta
MSSATQHELHSLVAEVVRNRNCSGCGACAALSPTLSMHLDTDGFLVPVPDDSAGVPPESAAKAFKRVCPGRTVRAPRAAPGGSFDPLFGPYISVWRAWAGDPDVRRRGSSGGVLTALTAWLVQSERVDRVVAAGADPGRPDRTVPVEIRSRDEALAAAGSRYAPVGVASLAASLGGGSAFVGKPCETDAVRRLLRPQGDLPLLMSFFCAGVPSQHATSELVGALGANLQEVTSLTYRGDGCPGDFVATTRSGHVVRASYQESWGAHLGRRLHDRCKICPDGTGMHADIAVGDLWATDDAGYPTFDENDGVSVALGRTRRGHELLLAARAAGVLVLEPVAVSEVRATQPSQVRRRRELPGRLAGRRLAGSHSPRFRGFGLLRGLLTAPAANIRAARGTYGRARRGR